MRHFWVPSFQSKIKIKHVTTVYHGRGIGAEEDHAASPFGGDNQQGHWPDRSGCQSGGLPDPCYAAAPWWGRTAAACKNIYARTQLSGAVDDWCCTLGKQLSKVGGIFKAEQVLAIISHHYTVASTQFAHNFWCAQLCNLLLSGAFLPFSSHFAMKDHPDLMQSGCCCTSTRGARPCLQS